MVLCFISTLGPAALPRWIRYVYIVTVGSVSHHPRQTTGNLHVWFPMAERYLWTYTLNNTLPCIGPANLSSIALWSDRAVLRAFPVLSHCWHEDPGSAKFRALWYVSTLFVMWSERGLEYPLPPVRPFVPPVYLYTEPPYQPLNFFNSAALFLNPRKGPWSIGAYMPATETEEKSVTTHFGSQASRCRQAASKPNVNLHCAVNSAICSAWDGLGTGLGRLWMPLVHLLRCKTCNICNLCTPPHVTRLL